MLNVVPFKFPKVNGSRLDDKDKVTRANSITGIIESERVKLIEGVWNNSFLHEAAAFPGARHDDQVDCLIMATLDKFFRKKQRSIRII